MLSLINGMLLLSTCLLPYQPHILHLQNYVSLHHLHRASLPCRQHPLAGHYTTSKNNDTYTTINSITVNLYHCTAVILDREKWVRCRTIV